MKLPKYLLAWLFSNTPKASAASALDQFERDIEVALAARKSRRAQRSEASRKGWQTRRTHNFN